MAANVMKSYVQSYVLCSKVRVYNNGIRFQCSHDVNPIIDLV